MPALLLFSAWVLGTAGLAGTGAARHALERLFRHRLSGFLADMSYSLYIIHLVLMLPFFGFFALRYTAGSPTVWLLATIGLLMVTLAVSWLMYRAIEVPGIALGKRLIARPLKAAAAPSSI